MVPMKLFAGWEQTRRHREWMCGHIRGRSRVEKGESGPKMYTPCCAKSLQLCPTLCNAHRLNPPGSSVHEILQARILEWVATSFSRGPS